MKSARPTAAELSITTRNASGSPASAAGLHAGSRQTRIGPYLIPLGGDVIVAIDGTTVKSMADLTVYLEMKTTVGQAIQLTVVRSGSQITIPVTLAARPVSST